MGMRVILVLSEEPMADDVMESGFKQIKLTQADRDHMENYAAKETSRHPIRQLEYQNQRLRDLVKSLRAEVLDLRAQLRPQRNYGAEVDALPRTPGGLFQDIFVASHKKRKK
jgi:hypothetical protein